MFFCFCFIENVFKWKWVPQNQITMSQWQLLNFWCLVLFHQQQERAVDDLKECHNNGKQYLHGELQELKAKGVSTGAGSGREIVYDLMCSFYLNDSATVLKTCGEDEVAMWSQRENEDEKLAQKEMRSSWKWILNMVSFTVIAWFNLL